MSVILAQEGFDPWRMLQRHQGDHLAPGSFGATASFVGTMRDFNGGDAVEKMFLEHYPGMTERELERIVTDAHARWDFLEALVVHRVGLLHPGEPIVLVAVWSAHRASAFTACRWIMEALKTRAPFWKREKTSQGERWVGKNTPGE